jgi:hypothetical protein
VADHGGCDNMRPIPIAMPAASVKVSVAIEPAPPSGRREQCDYVA